MPTQADIENIDNLSDEQKMALAHRAYDDYIQIVMNLTAKQRQILLSALKRIKETERLEGIDELEKQIHDLNN